MVRYMTHVRHLIQTLKVGLRFPVTQQRYLRELERSDELVQWRDEAQKLGSDIESKCGSKRPEKIEHFHCC